MDNESLRHFYFQNELTAFNKIHTPTGFLPQTFVKILRNFEFYAGLALLPPLIMMHRIFLDRRIRFLVLCVFVLAAGMLIETFLIPHYLAPFTAAFYAIGLQAMRHLRVWRPGGKPIGATIIRLEVAICLILACLRLFPGPLHLALPEWPVDVLPRAGTGSDRRQGPPGASMVWTVAGKRVDVCSKLLDAAGMGTSHMGLSAWPIGCCASWPFQLLDKNLSCRGNCRAWRSAGAGRASATNKDGPFRHGLMLAIGIVILALSRPSSRWKSYCSTDIDFESSLASAKQSTSWARTLTTFGCRQ
jgi:hypothetical protein